MQRPAVIKMIDKATAPIISNVFVNNSGYLCTLQISGTYTTATVAVQGVVTNNAQDWTDIAVFNLSNLDIEMNGMRGNGIYQASINGILSVRVNVKAVEGGYISVAANFSGTTVELPSPQNASYLVPPISAYDLAVQNGYTGTEEEFGEDMGNSAANSTSAANSADAAAASAQTAANTMQNLAPAYSSSATYAVGDYVTYNGILYTCSTAIPSGEAWNAEHWTQTKVSTELYAIDDSITIASGSAVTVSSDAWLVTKFIYAAGTGQAPGAVGTSTNLYKATPAIPIPSDAVSLLYSQMETTSTTSNGGIAFYSSSYSDSDPHASFVSGVISVRGQAQRGYRMNTVSIPANAKYVRLSYWGPNSETAALESTFYCAFLGEQKLKTILTPPSSNGTYALRATVSDGAIAYSWDPVS